MDAVASALYKMDPLVVDLNGNGIALDSWQTSSAFLVIDNISELFGNADISGFAQLKTYDSNGDGVINSADSQFGLLRLWNDKNANGTVDAGELTTLAANDNIPNPNLVIEKQLIYAMS